MKQHDTFPTNCDGCGVCCAHMGYPAYLDGTNGEPAELAWLKLPIDLRKELTEYIDQYQRPKSGLDGPCFWYDSKLRTCLHHEHRPRVCRDFQVGSADCIGWRRVYSIGETSRSP